MEERLPSESIRDLRDHLSEVIDRVNSTESPTVITRRGKEVGAIIPIDALRLFLQWEEEHLNRIVDERMSDPGPGVPLEDVIAETLARSE
ncbi:prevent-host-death family protein [Nocardiopsis mwathae]|uniref:Antitoxin n=1 Tax=Nocardiopsis mwathae TaxID=1472723 RepID=A0A7W9YHG6_9ACTN|nr:type II toxin-antitoxin system Phd/YefM family antitoxin [Nocardiopsis mwathae]MBB6172035.1 prevent-host-death family protein [Nocardiopsis mwathae]